MIITFNLSTFMEYVGVMCCASPFILGGAVITLWMGNAATSGKS